MQVVYICQLIAVTHINVLCTFSLSWKYIFGSRKSLQSHLPLYCTFKFSLWYWGYSISAYFARVVQGFELYSNIAILAKRCIVLQLHTVAITLQGKIFPSLEDCILYGVNIFLASQTSIIADTTERRINTWSIRVRWLMANIHVFTGWYDWKLLTLPSVDCVGLHGDFEKDEYAIGAVYGTEIACPLLQYVPPWRAQRLLV